MINPWKPARRDPDLERIEQLYREYRLPLWRYAFKLLHDEHLADDVVPVSYTHLTLPTKLEV